MNAGVDANRQVARGDAAGGDTVDVTAHVLDALMNETVELMDATVTLAEQRQSAWEVISAPITQYGDHHGPHDGGVRPAEIDSAISLRLAARLARVGGWLMAMTDRERPNETARQEAAEALHAAQRGGLDASDRRPPYAALAARIDQLVERSVRLDDMLARAAAEASLTGDAGHGRVIPFPLRAAH